MSDYRVIVRVQNGLIAAAMAAHGYKTVAELARASGVNQSSIGLLLNMKQSPVTKTGAFRDSVNKLALALNRPADELFTERQHQPVPDNVREFYVNENQVAQLINATANEPERLLALKEAGAILFDNPRLTALEAKVLALRFEHEETFRGIGEMLDLTPERVRQIEAKALSKLRDPSISGKVIDVYESLGA